MSRRRHRKRTQKGEPRRGKGGRLRKAAVILVGLALLFTALAGGLFLSGLVGDGSGPRTAAIVDQLSLTQPNPDFAASATSILEQAGYAVEYYPGEEVTVNFYRDLPAHGYDLIILRVHSGLVMETSALTGSRLPRGYVGLFTAEPFSETRYVAEVKAGALGPASYYEGGPQYFGVAPTFMESNTRGKFDDATVILMGCDGLRSYETGRSFVQRGAKAVVGWTGPVSASHTDAATERLLQHLVIDALSVQEAVTQTMVDVGPDPSYGSKLLA